MRFIFFFLWVALCLFTGAEAANYVVGYYPTWTQEEFTPDDLNLNRLTHVMHAFAWPSADGRLEYSRSFLNAHLNDVVHKAGKSIMISLGGWGNSDGFSPMAADSVSRKKFAAELLSFCLQYDYDGVDIDWEYPANSKDRQNMTLLVKDIRTEFRKPMRPQPLFISMAVTAGNWTGQWLDYDELQNDVDWFGCMAYDFHGPWSDHAGHNAPLYASGGDQCGSADSGIRYLTQTRNLPADKVLLGVPFYGRGFNATGLYQPSSGDGGEYTYFDIVELLKAGWIRHWDQAAKVPWLTNDANTKLISYDDTLSVRYKAEYAIQKELRGVMIWALGHDFIDGEQPLLAALSDPVLHPTKVVKSTEMPATFTLAGFPNPFNEATMISFSLAAAEEATLDIFDIQGKWLACLLSGRQQPGETRVFFYAQDFASGVYICRLKTASRMEIIKLTLLR